MTTTHTAPQVLIVGGGIGGIGAALMLGRRGIRVHLLEREPAFAEGGFGLQLGPNITRMLRDEGVLEDIAPNAVFPRRLVFRNAVSGEELNHLDCEDMERRYGSRYLVMHRGDLLEGLVRAALATGNVTLENDRKVVRVEDRADGVAAITEDGSRYEAQIVLGADGMHSRMRRLFVDDALQPTGFVAYRGTIPIDAVDPDLDLESVTVWMGPGLHLVQYPLRDAKEFNQVAVFESPAHARGELDWGKPEELLERFSSETGLHPSVVRAPRELGMARGWPMVDRDPLDTYVQGRVALLGDAAHATLQYLAQGAGQSLLDGASLAAHLAPLADSETWTPAQVQAALGAYDEERVAAASRVQTASRAWGEMWHVRSAGAVMVRDHAWRSHDRFDYDIVDWLYGPVRTEGIVAAADGSATSPGSAAAPSAEATPVVRPRDLHPTPVTTRK
ncbi:FAD-dependent monooxygenase [Brachybacterium kimchii]|uniref:FAD-dependent monooxygenase n=1 Tax=Brachybacterium kimchii TaxID=2942909 RepID=A0ABY4N6A5_9MICO|nr:FAD-dependent monooxygenase [Brachybacterium kimchii]UQN28973.1 FAD-dependent monooxygenase [Brachybacterium kimchii]